MRALAVAMVVVYHLYPSLVPGGFAGVDIFFVISGFLITGHLLREYRTTGTISLAGFWGRRARRLLPAAALVLTVTWVAAQRVLTASQLADTAAQIRASALYFQNWQLAHNAVDYLQSADTASPVQHFWSLSVEEQFYLLWPLLFIVAAIVTWLASHLRRGGAPRGVPDGAAARGTGRGWAIIGVLTTALVLASLWYSRADTRADPAAAYFVTTTRIWELGAGGLLALLPSRVSGPLGRQGWLGWAGLGLAVASGFLLTGTMAFPGLVALLPVGATVLLIGCGSAGARFGPARLMSLRPLVFIGGISYSLYLWHWPLISLWTSYRGHAIGALSGPVIAAISILLAWLTRIGVEDPVRRARLLSGHRWRSVCTALAVALPVALVTGYLVSRPAWNGKLPPGYPGAVALAHPGHGYPVKAVLPPPDSSSSSLLPAYWRRGCLVDVPSSDAKACAFGDTRHPRLTIALVGDSIAGNWFGALNVIARQEHWRLVTELHGECLWTSTMTWFSSATQNHPYTACHDWGAAVTHDLITTIRPDVVITSGSQEALTPGHRQVGVPERTEVAAGMAAYWKQLIGHGIPVIAISETPHLTMSGPDCLMQHASYDQDCTTARSTALIPDPPTYYAARLMKGKVPVIDMSSLICAPTQCRVVVGNVLAYRDSKHFTASFSQTLAPVLKPRLLADSPVLRAG